MALGVNQNYKNYYTVRLGTLTTQHQIQSNRVTLFTNEITDIASKINFFENQKVLTLVTPDNAKLAIGAKYFDLPKGFVANDETTWGGADNPFYTTPCQKQIFIYRKLASSEINAGTGLPNTAAYASNPADFSKDSDQWYQKIPYTDGAGKHSWETGYTPTAGAQSDILDSRILSNRLMTGEFILMYTNDENKIQKVGYKDLTFISESQDKTAYQETVEELEAQRNNINEMQKNVQQEMQTTEVQIQAIQSMMESTDKVLQKNTETFKWGA